MVENNQYCRKVLKKNFPGIPIIEDVKNVTQETLANATRNIENGIEGESYSEYAGRDSWLEFTGSSDRQYIKGSEYPMTNSEGNDAGQFEIEAGNKKRTADSVNRKRLRDEFRRCSKGEIGIDIISGGFPCQPHSVAGKRQGSSDERNLWPEFRRIIGEIKPRWVVGENVPGIFSSDAGRFFGEVVRDLAEMGYSVGWCTFGAVDVGALHRRNRVFIVAHTVNGQYRGESGPTGETEGIQGINRETILPWEFSGTSQESSIVGYSECNGCTNRCKETERKNGRCEQRWLCESERTGFMVDSTERGLERAESEGKTRTERLPTECGEIPYSEFVNGDGWGYGASKERQQEQRKILESEYWQFEPDVGRVANGVPHRVDRLRGLGNAVVPQQIYPIYKAIVDIENELRFAQ